MKRISKMMWQYIGGINGGLLILYSLIVSAAYAFVSTESGYYFLRWLFIGAVICVAGCPVLLRWFGKISIGRTMPVGGTREKAKYFLLLFAIVFCVLFVRFIACYPGGFSPDSINQYGQTVDNSYSDWHPVIHTLFAFKLPLALTGGWIGSVVLFQIIVFSAVAAYSLSSVRQYANTPYVVLALFFILLNPKTFNMVMYPWKDIGFAMGALLLVTYSLHIYRTKGQWLKKPIHMAAFVLTAVLTTLFRHNALLFTIPLLAAVVFVIKPKRALAVCLSIAALLAAIKYPLYSALAVEEPDERQVEMLGLPMTVIGAAVVDAPETLDEEILEFAYKVAPREVWEDKYTFGSYNYVKRDARTDNSVIESYGPAKVLSMMLDCISSCPRASLKGLIQLTAPVYAVSDTYKDSYAPLISENDYGIENGGIPALNGLIQKAASLLNCLFPHLFVYQGVIHLAFLALLLAKSNLKKWSDWKRIFFVLPLFIYNFGTAILLTGAEDAYRFYYYAFLIAPVLVVFLCGKEKERSMDFSICEET